MKQDSGSLIARSSRKFIAVGVPQLLSCEGWPTAEKVQCHVIVTCTVHGIGTPGVPLVRAVDIAREATCLHLRCSSPAAAATPKNRRGDIHSSLSLTPTPRRARRTTNNDDLNSDGTNLALPTSSARNFSAADAQSDEPAEIRAIWGTTVNLAETMKSFREFMLGFKPKYRVSYDRNRGVRTRTLATPEEGEVLLYETYLRRMRQTGSTNLNLDMNNLAAYPPSKKLYTQLIKYPQEVVPAMDQVLKDLMLEIAEGDQQAGMEGMAGEEGEEEIADIMGKVYKIRPFGLPSVNMRELNPTGSCSSVYVYRNV